MTTNPTIDGVPRKMLTALLCNLDEFHNRALADELRALLDAPATCVCRGCFTEQPIGKACATCAEVEAQRAAQPQGEPVAKSQWDVSSNPVLGYADSYRAMARQGVKEVSVWSVITDLERNIAPLYAKQPAPVAVVLPERLREIHDFLLGSESLDGYAFGSLHPSGRKYWWRNELRACLDELKRPAHANPPPGAEPCGTHRDNDGLDDYRKPEQE